MKSWRAREGDALHRAATPSPERARDRRRGGPWPHGNGIRTLAGAQRPGSSSSQQRREWCLALGPRQRGALIAWGHQARSANVCGQSRFAVDDPARVCRASLRVTQAAPAGDLGGSSWLKHRLRLCRLQRRADGLSAKAYPALCLCPLHHWRAAIRAPLSHLAGSTGSRRY